MKKKILFLLMFFPAAHHAVAADNRFDIASLDKDSYRHDQRKALAPAVREKHEHYLITGYGEQGLRDQMSRQGVSWNDGKKYDSVTNWRVTWDYEHDQSSQSCSTEAFQASAEITIRYPKWVLTEDAPQELIDKWEVYLASLIVHEEGHRDMVVEAMNDLTRAVAQLPAAPTCAELDRKVRSLCHERLAKLNDEAKDYDAATLHGAQQGAVFP